MIIMAVEYAYNGANMWVRGLVSLHAWLKIPKINPWTPIIYRVLIKTIKINLIYFLEFFKGLV